MYNDDLYYGSGSGQNSSINLPETAGGYSPYSGGDPKPPRKKSKAPRTIAAVLGIAMLSAAAGGGGAWVVLQHYEMPTTVIERAAPVQQTSDSGEAAVPLTNPEESGVIATVAAAASPSVVEISTETASYNPFFGQAVQDGAGSGVIISEDGFIVTNNHVVVGASGIVVRDYQGNEYQAKLVGADEKTDLAVIKIEASGLTAATLADSDGIQVGELAVAIGNPLGQLGGTVTSGIISAKGREINIDNQAMTLLQTSAAVNPGNSGGGLFDSSGQLVGIVNAKSAGSGVEGLAFAIPSNTVQNVVESIIQNGYVAGRPKLGVTVQEVSRQEALYYQLRDPGVYIIEPGENAELQSGDRIVKLGDTEISSSQDLSKALDSYRVGDTVTLVVSRNGREVTANVTLTEMVPEGVVVNKL